MPQDTIKKNLHDHSRYNIYKTVHYVFAYHDKYKNEKKEVTTYVGNSLLVLKPNQLEELLN